MYAIVKYFLVSSQKVISLNPLQIFDFPQFEKKNGDSPSSFICFFITTLSCKARKYHRFSLRPREQDTQKVRGTCPGSTVINQSRMVQLCSLSLGFIFPPLGCLVCFDIKFYQKFLLLIFKPINMRQQLRRTVQFSPNDHF